MKKRIVTRVFIGLLVIILVPVLWFVTLQPSNDGEWNRSQQLLAYADIDGDSVTISHVRSNVYRSENDYDVRYVTENVSLNKLDRVDFILVPFSKYKGPAHTFLSFRFGPNNYVAISIESRRQHEESFSILRGMLRRYNVIYIVANESDAVKLRSNYQRDSVYIYPLRLTREQGRELFVDMLRNANLLTIKPEFYNTLTNSCTTMLYAHINQVTGNKLGIHYSMFLPAYSDAYLYQQGLLDRSLPFAQLKEQHLVNRNALRYGEDKEFSEKIRSYGITSAD